MRIAIDIDSTLHHYWDQLASAAERRFGIELPYDDQLDWGISRLRPEQLEVCIAETHRDDSILAAVPYPGAVEAVRGWKDDGHFVHITSHRVSEAHGATERWLRDIGLPYDELYCSFDKITRCREIGIDVLIDDSPMNLRNAVDAGLLAATLEHPWNADVREEEDVISAADWPGLATALAPFFTTRD
ncbi:MAG: hypothetical protein JHC95_18775 [Solirubrobacteraceae bacterium]|nr:hypothetical protein [Solirubrobacteraceae bacterium]